MQEFIKNIAHGQITWLRKQSYNPRAIRLGDNNKSNAKWRNERYYEIFKSLDDSGLLINVVTRTFKS